MNNKDHRVGQQTTSMVTVNKAKRMLKRRELIAPPWTSKPIFVNKVKSANKVSKVDKVNNKQNVEKTSVEHLMTPTSGYKAFVCVDDHEKSEEEILVDDLKESVCQKVKIQENNNPNQLIWKGMLVKEWKDNRYYQKKDDGKSLLVNKFLKQPISHLKSRLDAIRESDTQI